MFPGMREGSGGRVDNFYELVVYCKARSPRVLRRRIQLTETSGTVTPWIKP